MHTASARCSLAVLLAGLLGLFGAACQVSPEAADDAGAIVVDAAAPDGASGSGCAVTCPSAQVCCPPGLPCAGSCVHDCRAVACSYGLTCYQALGVCGPGGTAGAPGAAGGGGAGGVGRVDAGGVGGNGGAAAGGACTNASCQPGAVCCAAPFGCAGLCVPDCRSDVGCPSALSCSASAGVCQPSGAQGGAGGTLGMPPLGGAGGGQPPIGGGAGGTSPTGGRAGSGPSAGGSGGRSPSGTTCGGTVCQSGQVCCAAPAACANSCVPDCRTGAACPNNLTCNATTGVCQSAGGGTGGMPGGTGGMGGMPGGMGGMPGGMGGMPGGMGGMPGGMGGMPAGTGGTGGTVGGTGGTAGTGPSCGGPSGPSGATCTLTSQTSPTATVTGGCTLLSRDTSACAACRTALGLSGFWLRLSCRVGLSVVTTNGSKFVRVQVDSQPDYQTPYFQTPNVCSGGAAAKLNPNRIVAQTVSFDAPFSPTVNATTTKVGGGIMGTAVNGVVIFGNSAAPGDDIYLESQTFDVCRGHPEKTGTYHYHAEPYAISYDDANFIGVMRDGHPLYGRRDVGGTTPTLDVAGGHTGTTADSPTTPVYHYHVNEQTSTASTSLGLKEWFLTKGQYRGTPGACTGCGP